MILLAFQKFVPEPPLYKKLFTIHFLISSFISQIMKLLLFLLILPILLTIGQSQPTICLSQGACYLGSWAKTDKGAKYATFQGIRYAQPPIGDLR